jgi:hypothetical protein
VLRECGGAPAVAFQWLFCVFVPSIALLAFLRVLKHRWWHERDVVGPATSFSTF